MAVLWFVIIGAVAGWLAGQFMRGYGFGLLGDIVVGIIGAFIGGYLLPRLRIEIGQGMLGSLIAAFVGAVLLLFVVRLFTGQRSGRTLGFSLAILASLAGTASAQDRDDDHQRADRTITVVCESRDGRRHRCAADTLGQITLGRQLTGNSNCVEDRTWGYDSKGIWVDRGCRAEFLIADNGGTYRERGPSQAMRTVVCESNGAQRSYCRADARFGVQLRRQLSRNDCILNRTFGSDRSGVWVSHGCRAELALKTRD